MIAQAPKLVRVEITQDDIKDGDPNSVYFGALSRALNRALGIDPAQYEPVAVRGRDITWRDRDGVRRVAPLPDAAQAWDHVYESYGPAAVHPWRFTLWIDP